jgi:hypothetical protein
MEEAVLKEKRMPKAKTTTSEAPKKTRKAKSGLTHEEIAFRAYQIYQERGYMAGDPMQDWLRAELELARKPKKAARKTKVVSIAA